MPDGRVQAWPLNVSEETLFNLEDNLVLFYRLLTLCFYNPQRAGREDEEI